MNFIKGLKCRECGREYEESLIYVCEYCFGPLEVNYDYAEIKKALSREKISNRRKNLWRYIELLPVHTKLDEISIGLNTGFTPLIRARNLAAALDVKELYIKDDSVNHPTLSFKDRVVAVALTKAKEFNINIVACASTGNLAHAVSAHAAASGLKSYIFIPHDLEKAKVVSCLIYGANVISVLGNYDDVNRLCGEIASRYKWGFVNVNLRPYYAEGSKTMGFEIAEQLDWQTPQHLVCPAASGSLISKIYKGFKELQELGLIEEVKTKFHIAQAEGCSPIVKALKENADIIKPLKPNTIAKSLAIGNPADGYYALEVVEKTKGSGEAVSDEEIIEGIKLLAETEGIFTETAGGVTVATAKKLIESGKIPKDESIVLAITGQGLKTQEAVINRLKKPREIEASIHAFEKVINNAGF